MAYSYDLGGNLVSEKEYAYTTGTLPAAAAVTKTGTYDTVWKDKLLNNFYDHTGNRIRKVVDGVTTQFRYAGDLLVSERTGSEKNLWYRYDSAGNVISVTYDSVFYTYVRNVQNEVIALIDSQGNEVVRYAYDSWGRGMSITGSMSETLEKKNPFRYRGYVGSFIVNNPQVQRASRDFANSVSRTVVNGIRSATDYWRKDYQERVDAWMS